VGADPAGGMADCDGAMNAQDVSRQAAYQAAKILADDCPAAVKYQELDELQLWVMREHPDGLAAGVLKIISDAQTKVMYPERKS
jgi:hypothetical protein